MLGGRVGETDLCSQNRKEEERNPHGTGCRPPCFCEEDPEVIAIGVCDTGRGEREEQGQQWLPEPRTKSPCQSPSSCPDTPHSHMTLRY